MGNPNIWFLRFYSFDGIIRGIYKFDFCCFKALMEQYISLTLEFNSVKSFFYWFLLFFFNREPSKHFFLQMFVNKCERGHMTVWISNKNGGFVKRDLDIVLWSIEIFHLSRFVFEICTLVFKPEVTSSLTAPPSGVVESWNWYHLKARMRLPISVLRIFLRICSCFRVMSLFVQTGSDVITVSAIMWRHRKIKMADSERATSI